MPCTEIRWRTHYGDIASTAVHGPTIDLPDCVRLTIGHDLHLHIPPAEARRLAQALLEAAAEIPTSAPPRTLYHDPDEFMEA